MKLYYINGKHRNYKIKRNYTISMMENEKLYEEFTE